MPSVTVRDSAMPLWMAEVGREMILHDVSAEPDLKVRLAAMGLYPGVKLKVISRSAQGSCIVAVKECRLVLDRETVHHILVR